MNDASPLILPAGRTGAYCAHCHGAVDRTKGDLNRRRRQNYKTFCNIKCFRASQVKYKNLTPKEKQQAYDRTARANKRAKRSSLEQIRIKTE